MNRSLSIRIGLLAALLLLPMAGCGTGGSFSTNGNAQDSPAPDGDIPAKDGLSVPAAPTDLVATMGRHSWESLDINSLVNLTWTDNAGNEAAFSIQRSYGPDLFTRIADNIPMDSESFTDENPAAVHQCYQVRAQNSAGFSAWSNKACISE